MDNEIDLIELFLKIFNFIKNKIKVILIVIFVGAIMATISYYVYPNFLTYKITGYSPYIENNVVCNRINEISSELKNNNLVDFCESNNLDIKTFENIKSITPNILKDSPESNIEISIITKMPLDIKDVSKELENYITRDTYISNKISFRESQLKSTISFISKQIDIAENKNDINYNELKFIIQEESTTSLFFKKNKGENELAFLEPLIVTNISTIPKVNKSGIFVFIIFGSLIAVVLLFVYFFFKKINKLTIKEQIRKPETSFYRKSA